MLDCCFCAGNRVLGTFGEHRFIHLCIDLTLQCVQLRFLVVEPLILVGFELVVLIVLVLIELLADIRIIVMVVDVPDPRNFLHEFGLEVDIRPQVNDMSAVHPGYP